MRPLLLLPVGLRTIGKLFALLAASLLAIALVLVFFGPGIALLVFILLILFIRGVIKALRA